MRYLLGLIFVSYLFAQTPAPMKDKAWGIISDSLKDKNPDTRVQAVQSMGLIGVHEPYISTLNGMLDDKDVQVRVAVVTSLVDLKNKDTVPALKKALNDEVPEVSFAAAKALWTLKDPEGENALLSVLSGDVKASSSFFNKQKRDALRLLQTPRPLMMVAIRAGAGFAPVPGLGMGISSLQGILNDPTISGRAATALLLADDKDPRVLAALIDALQDKEGSVRAAACHAIALRNDPKLEANLIPLLDDKKPAVRLRAAAGCLRLESLPAPPVKKPVAKKTATTAAKK
ncbi:MAG: HEAT repeat domain-containing protein [Bryobacteraceae bacterium]